MQPKLKFLILIFIFISHYSIAQVVIKEKVEIKPQAILSSSPMTNHSVRIEMTWTPAYIPGAILAAGIPCREAEFSGFSSTGSQSHEIINDAAGSYWFQLRFAIPCTYPLEPVNGHYYLYFDNVLVQEESFNVIGCYSGTSYPFYDVVYSPPLISGYVLNLDNYESCFLTSTAIGINTANDCSSNVSWNKLTEPITVSITSGDEYASFYNGNDELIGNSFNGTFSEFQSITLVQDSMYSDSV
jgi:hypothetical protein